MLPDSGLANNKGDIMKLTSKELYIIEAIVSNEMSENNYRLPSYLEDYEDANCEYGCWADTIEQNGAQNGDKVTGKAISGVVASLNKKGYVRSIGAGSEATVIVTKNGWHAYQVDMVLMKG